MEIVYGTCICKLLRVVHSRFCTAVSVASVPAVLDGYRGTADGKNG